jgi:hypothetical protein
MCVRNSPVVSLRRQAVYIERINRDGLQSIPCP